MILYSIDDYFKQAKHILIQKIDTLPELSYSSVCVVETSKKSTHVFVAIADGLTFEVYSGIITNDMKPLEKLIRVEGA